MTHLTVLNALKYTHTFFPALVFLVVVSPHAVYSFEGPLAVKNQYPLSLHVNQPYLEKASMENSLSAGLSHSSIYTVQNSSEWVINLDMEITELNLRYKRIIQDFIEFSVEVPVLGFSDGFMDGFLESYHSTFGFPDYGRSRRPLNSFLYEVRKNGTLVVEGETGAGLGDIRIALKKPLIALEGFRLGVRGEVELPTGRAKKGYGNGSVDAGVSVLVDKIISRFIMTYWNIGAVFPGNVKGYQETDLENFIYGGIAVETYPGENFSFIVQLQGQSAVYPETDISAVDRPAFLLALGGRYKTGKGALELSLTEDISTSGAPDFILNFSYKIKL